MQWAVPRRFDERQLEIECIVWTLLSIYRDCLRVRKRSTRHIVQIVPRAECVRVYCVGIFSSSELSGTRERCSISNSRYSIPSVYKTILRSFSMYRAHDEAVYSGDAMNLLCVVVRREVIGLCRQWSIWVISSSILPQPRPENRDRRWKKVIPDAIKSLLEVLKSHYSTGWNEICAHFSQQDDRSTAPSCIRSHHAYFDVAVYAQGSMPACVPA